MKKNDVDIVRLSDHIVMPVRRDHLLLDHVDLVFMAFVNGVRSTGLVLP